MAKAPKAKDKKSAIAGSKGEHAVSPLAPAKFATLPPLAGVRLAAGEAGVRYKDRTDVLLEGGPTLAGAFLRAGVIDRILAYVAPILLGGPITAVDDVPEAVSGVIHPLARLNPTSRFDCAAVVMPESSCRLQLAKASAQSLRPPRMRLASASSM